MVFNKTEYNKRYNKNHANEFREYNHSYNRRPERKKYFAELMRLRNFQNRFDAILHYSNGNMKCDLCPENDIDILCIDHVNHNGAEHRKEMYNTRICDWLRRHNYPDGFRILCFNCNMKEEIRNLRQRLFESSQIIENIT